MVFLHATMTGTIVAQLLRRSTEDTDVDVFTGVGGACCGSISDDAYCGDITGGNNYTSEIEFDVVTGETYYFFWDDTWGPGAFTWYLYESPLAPRNLVANGGIQSASLDWQAYDIPEQEAVNRFNQPQKKLEFQSESYLQKKSQIRTDDSDTRNTFWVNSNYSSGSRSTAVTIECDGGVYQSEVSWDLLDANGSVIIRRCTSIA